MIKRHLGIVGICLVGLLLSVSGCNESHAQKKKEMIEQWEKSSASAQLPAIENLLEQGQIQKAKNELAKCLQADPEMPGAYILVGRIHFLEGRNELAYEAFEQAVQLNPELDQAWHFMGSLAVLKRDYQQAIEHFQKAIELMPVKSEYIISLSDVYIETEQFEQAREIINKGLDDQPQNLELLLSKAQLCQRLGQMQEAIRFYEQALLMHGDLPEILEPCGYAYVSQKQWADAAEKFSLLLEQCKQNEDRYNATMRTLATCLFNSGQYGRALVWYDKLSVMYRDDAEVWLNMAQAALNTDDSKRASYCAINALKVRPSWTKAYAVLGCARYMQGFYEQSLRAFNKVSDDDELGAFAWFMTGRCYQQLGQNRQANAAYERAEELDPNNKLISAFMKKTIHPL